MDVIERIFARIDADNSGEVTHEEMETAFKVFDEDGETFDCLSIR